MNVPVTCRGGLHPPSRSIATVMEHDLHHVEGRMQSAPTKLVCSLSEITLVFNHPRLKCGAHGKSPLKWTERFLLGWMKPPCYTINLGALHPESTLSNSIFKLVQDVGRSILAFGFGGNLFDRI
jgi:hypothetical protein